MISELKLELIRKIIAAKLTAEEMQDITNKAQEIIDRRPCSQNTGSIGEKVLHGIPLYEQTDTAGILEETQPNKTKRIDG